MTVLHSGSNNKYSANWEQVFGKGKKKGSTVKRTAAAKKKASPKKKAAKRAR